MISGLFLCTLFALVEKVAVNILYSLYLFFVKEKVIATCKSFHHEYHNLNDMVLNYGLLYIKMSFSCSSIR